MLFLAALILVGGIIISQPWSPPPAMPAFLKSGASLRVATTVVALSGKPEIHLDVINIGKRTFTPVAQRAIRVQMYAGQSLELRGWAVDLLDKSAPSAIVAQVDDFTRSRATLIQRRDVAAKMGNAAYIRSGFVFSIPPAALPEGEHRVAALVENPERTGYYVEPHWLFVSVRSIGSTPTGSAAKSARRAFRF